MIVPMTKARVAALLVIAATAAPSINAHGNMGLPKPTFAIQGDTTQFGLTVDSSALTAPAGMSFTTDPNSNTKAFNAALKASTYKDLKSLIAAKGQPIAGANKECGITTSTGPKQPLPAMVEWTHGSGEGFTPSHEGPCEVWCDNVKVFTDDNCSRNFPAAPARLPYDKAKCAGKSVLKIIWLALHSPTWQAYINCAAIEGGAAGAGGSTTPASTPKATSKTPATTKAPATKAPAKPATKAPAKPTPAPVAGDADDEDCEDELPIAGDADEDCEDELPLAGGADEYNDEVGGDADVGEVGGDADAGEVGGDADAGEVGADADDEDCEDDIPIAGDADEDCEDELPVAGDSDEDCDEEYDVAGEAVRTSDLDFSSITEDDQDDIGTVEGY